MASAKVCFLNLVSGLSAAAAFTGLMPEGAKEVRLIPDGVGKLDRR